MSQAKFHQFNETTERAKRGKRAEVAVQTEASRLVKDYWKRQVERIIDHETGGSKMGVRFITKWLGYRIQLKERSDIILERGGKKILTNYLQTLERQDKKRMNALLRNEPRLAELLAEDAPAAPAAQNINPNHLSTVNRRTETKRSIKQETLVCGDECIHQVM